MGFKYCDVLAIAVSRNPVWEEARVKLKQLLVKRIAGGRFLRTTNPIYLLDLEHLIAWKDKITFGNRGRRACTLEHKPIAESDLPAGYVLTSAPALSSVLTTCSWPLAEAARSASP